MVEEEKTKWCVKFRFGQLTLKKGHQLPSACMVTCQEPNWPIKCILSQRYAKTILHSQNVVVNTARLYMVSLFCNYWVYVHNYHRGNSKLLYAVLVALFQQLA